MVQRILEPEVMDSPQAAIEYDRMDFTAVNTDFARTALQLGARGHILDIGTGTARIPIILCQFANDSTMHITAIDLAQSMLDLAKINVTAAQLEHQITLELADAKQLPYADHTFDVVISNSIVHHLPDPRPFFREALRVLKPGGGILIRDLMRPKTIEELEQIVDTIGAGYNPDQRQLFYDSLHAAFTLEEVETMLVECQWPGVEVYASSDRHWTISRPFLGGGVVK
ncbi:MAG: class I SAM-dependent methyltransferase [Pseudanabaenaceae cyanobacterium SKYGB_i_bin29]|nr:class I SAM-dependent methyltransferase [Pseudanabaenaceae cyanobacterium SKYG29]MDW8421648.1 class I SAM-dependent methyltransferase [Pseudanabaenaceae cyanobacterium SKYGB_i_bin29]